MNAVEAEHRDRSGAQKPQLWPVFICYRHVDGSPAARRLYEVLDKWVTKGPDGEEIEIDAYLDETMPGVADWKNLHRPYLERARAIIVICTPAAWINDGPDDWVHMEIDWWLANRCSDPVGKDTPILVDPLAEGPRYVPPQIAKRWPDIQRISLIEAEWEGLDATTLQEKTDAVRRQIIGAVLPSGAAIYQRELQTERRRAQRLKRSLLATVILLILAVLAGAYAVVQVQISEASRQDARAAELFAEARLLDTRWSVLTDRDRDLSVELASEDLPDVIRQNLGIEQANTRAEMTLVRTRHDRVLVDGRGALADADAVWDTAMGRLGQRIFGTRDRPEAPFIFSIELMGADSGQNLLVHYGTPDNVKILMIDGGPPPHFRKTLKPRLQEISQRRFKGQPVPLELLVIGDRDNDKTGGLIRLLKHETEAKAGDHPSLVDIQQIWGNVLAGRPVKTRIRRDAAMLGIPFNAPFGKLMVRPDHGRLGLDLPDGMQAFILGPAQEDLQPLARRYIFELENAKDRDQPWPDDGLPKVLEELMASIGVDHLPVVDAPLDISRPKPPKLGDTCRRSTNARTHAKALRPEFEEGRFRDISTSNVASSIVLFRFKNRTFLLTADSNSVQIVKGLAAARLLDADGRINVDLMSVPHAGSELNVTPEFFGRVQANHYLFSGDGRHNNPEVSTVAALIDQRPCETFWMHFSNRIKPDRRSDPTELAMENFFLAEQAFRPNYRRVFRTTERGSTIIDLGDPVRY